ncbi:MAG: ATP-dependent 6-phosphofructokinase, partial [Deltaproteobacteria bacterium]|nr:ATP-dependent 6-phosphofructokinase [Deltaproteobacteria bacterium]
GLNAVIRAVVLKSLKLGWKVFGVEDATEGLIDLDYRSHHGNRWLEAEHVDDILTKGGTILGTSNRSDPFRYVVERDGKKVETDVSDRVVANFKKMKLDALISVGGDGSMEIAQQFGELGIPIVGVPKTIDQDLGATDYTFGFNTAVQCAANSIDRLQDTAASHDRVMILEVMGRNAGWIALHAAMAGGAHVCLIPEIPYRVQPIVEHIRSRRKAGAPFSIVVVAEGAAPKEGEQSMAGPQELGAMPKLFGAGFKLAAALEPHLKLDVRVTVLGHIQRGGTPTQFDRILGTRFGTAAVDAVAAGQFGHMVALRTPRIEVVPISEALANERRVDPAGQIVQSGRDVDICFGD